jgi:hypothetical protein
VCDPRDITAPLNAPQSEVGGRGGNMNKPVLWSVDEARRTQLEVIARRLKLKTYPELMNMAIDEFIIKHSTTAKLESPTK